MAAPIYAIGDVVCLKESAALGFVEPVRINGVYNNSGDWVYTLHMGVRRPTSLSSYGDRRSMTTGAVLYFSEDELITQCAAYDLAIENLQSQLTLYNARKAALGCE